MDKQNFATVGGALLTVVNKKSENMRRDKVVSNVEGVVAHFMYMYYMVETELIKVVTISKTVPHISVSHVPFYTVVDTFESKEKQQATDHYETYKTMLEDAAKEAAEKVSVKMVYDDHTTDEDLITFLGAENVDFHETGTYVAIGSTMHLIRHGETLEKFATGKLVVYPAPEPATATN